LDYLLKTGNNLAMLHFISIGKYYYGFGFNGPNPLSDLWEFDPVDSSFTQLPSCPCEGRSHPALIAHNDKVYMGAGSGANNDLNDWWEYDMLTQVWTQKPNIPGGQRHNTFQFTIGDDIYVGGGHVFNWLKYSPDTEEWTAIDDLPDGRVAGSQFSHGKNGYLLGGDNYLHQHIPTAQTFMRYDAEMDDWEFLKSLPNGSRWAPSSFIINDILYYFGGESYFIPNDRTMWKFDLLSLDPPVSTDNIQDLENSIFAYPNPVQDKLNFGGEFNPDITYDLSLINTNGQTILREQKFNLNEELDVAALPQGIYIIQLKDEEATVQIKLLKTK